MARAGAAGGGEGSGSPLHGDRLFSGGSKGGNPSSVANVGRLVSLPRSLFLSSLWGSQVNSLRPSKHTNLKGWCTGQAHPQDPRSQVPEFRCHLCG